MENDYLKELKTASYRHDHDLLVSVVMIAYNVENYLTEAIESVLVQKTNFKVELVIGEDCSTDNTRKIALDYQMLYPHLIRVLLPPKNQGLTPNCIATHNACSGKYIALLDGDDYWTDDLKLQKQIDFLEKNPQYAGCAHQSIKIYSNELKKDEPFGSNNDEVYVLKDTISHRKFHTSSLVYHKKIWDKVGGIPPNISSNERAIYPMVALFGKIKYFQQAMCVYRLTGSGLTSRVNYKELESDFNMLNWLKKINSEFPVCKFKSFLYLCNYTYGVKKIPLFTLTRYYMMFCFYSFSYFPNNFADLKWGSVFFVKRINQSHLD